MHRVLSPERWEQAFTLLEIMTVLVVILILGTMSVGAFRSVQSRAERSSCMSNLRNLYSGASSYIQDHEEWPQVSTKDVQSPSYALAWVRSFERYGFGRSNWVCPTVQRQLKNPDLNDDRLARVDYIAMPFDANPRAAFRWPTQPWFIERGDVHGEGQLLIFANGQVKSVREVLRDRPQTAVEWQ